MTNYNDGKWHGWNGGECPVHPETVVDIAHLDRGLVSGESAVQWFWDVEKSSIIAFRVIKEHKEPREFWVVQGAMGKHIECGYKTPDAFKVREVLE